MKNEIFYITIENRRYRFEGGNINDYHIERVPSAYDIEKIIEEKRNFYTDTGDFFVITNDQNILSKYIFSLNVDDLKFLCNVDKFDKYKVRISKYNFRLHQDFYQFFFKIFVGENLSASMNWISEKIYPWEDSSFYEFTSHFSGWILDNEFSYTKDLDEK